MNRIIEIKQIVGDSELLNNMYSIEQLTQDIIKIFDTRDNLNNDDYNYINTITNRARITLQKVYEVIKI